MIQFAESFRLHAAMAEFLRQEVYRHDGIAYHSQRSRTCCRRTRTTTTCSSPRCCDPSYPLVVVVHDEADEPGAQPVRAGADRRRSCEALADPASYGLDAEDGLGVVVPHRAQRAALQQAFPELSVLDPATGLPSRLGRRHGGAVPGRRADGDPGQRHRERPGLPAGLRRVPARPAPPDGGPEPGEAEDDPGGLPQSSSRCSAPTRRRSPTRCSGRTCCAAPAPCCSGRRAGRQRVEVWGNPPAVPPRSDPGTR